MVIARLREGGLFYYYHTIIREADIGAYELVRRLYPITIEELHAGWIKGRERTITCVSGTYAVGGTQAPAVVLFTKDGKRSPAPPVPTPTAGKPEWTVDLSGLAPGSIAVIERQDR